LVFFPEFSDLQMRYTKKVSMWPVGLVTKVGLSSPVVNNKGVVIDFFDGWMANRKFPVDMAGFAVSVQLVLKVSTDDS
jgi:beta-1,3-glucuronyltransferase